MAPKGSKQDDGGDSGTRRNAISTGAPAHLTRVQRHLAMDALRDLIRPHISTTELLEVYLEAADWDVDAAYQLYTTDAEAVDAGLYGEEESLDEGNGEEDSQEDETVSMVGSASEADTTQATILTMAETSDQLDLMREAELPSRGNVEQERRDAALALRELISTKTAGAVTLTRSEAILLLHLANWDLSRAAERFKDLPTALGRLQSAYGAFITASTRKDTLQQDEMLARLIEITDRPDWWSLRQFLDSFEWDFVDAIVEWYRHGIPVVLHPRDRDSRPGQGMGRRVDYLLVPRPAPDEDTVKAEPDPEEGGWDDDLDHYDDYALKKGEAHRNDSDVPKEGIAAEDRKRTKGFIINEPKANLQPGCTNPQRLLCEYIQKGKYRRNRFKNPKFLWPGLIQDAAAEDDEASEDEQNNEDSTEDDAELPTAFDWHNPEHFALLKAFWRQAKNRVTAVKKRLRSQAITQEENDFLHKLFRDYVESLTKKSGTAPRLPVSVPMAVREEWTRQFNQKLVGTQPAGARNVRFERTLGAIWAAIGRNEAIIEAFKVTRTDGKKTIAKKSGRSQKRPASPAHSSKSRPKAKKNKADADDADDEESEDSVIEDDDDN